LKISRLDIKKKVDYKALVDALRRGFSGREHQVPERSHLELPNNNLALLMPAWNNSYYGLKQIIACPDNSAQGLPTIQGTYNLFDVQNGRHLAELEATKLTAVRTAATSVLASSFFVQKPERHLILGDGVIGKHLAEAYTAYYEIQNTVIWSRSTQETIDLEKEIARADIISCATHAYQPILHGNHLQGRTHIDLVGSYKIEMREADDDVITKSEIYIDDWPAVKESGDLALPIRNGIISTQDIRGTLFDLCKGAIKPNMSDNPTLFKSVGHAIEDLVAAIYFYELYRA